MKQLIGIWKAHAARYPEMQPVDAIKLAFQATYGGGHLIRDPESSLARMEEELAQAENRQGEETAEDIGGGFVRIHLRAAARAGYALPALNRDFVRSGSRASGRETELKERLSLLRQMAGDGLFSFGAEEMDQAIAAYAAGGYGMVSHSEAYRRAYAPCYRVLARRYSAFLLEEEIRSAVKEDRPFRIALDGRCASGKSTLGQALAEKYGLLLLHMDDFFLRPEQRTPERFRIPGGNVDHERFLEEVLLPLTRGEQPVYRPFDCSSLRVQEAVPLPPARQVLVEGSYSCHPELAPYYDLRVFLSVSPETQLQRIAVRNGEEGLARFRERWIPLEEQYLEACRTEARCDYSLSGEKEDNVCVLIPSSEAGK